MYRSREHKLFCDTSFPLALYIFYSVFCFLRSRILPAVDELLIDLFTVSPRLDCVFFFFISPQEVGFPLEGNLRTPFPVFFVVVDSGTATFIAGNQPFFCPLQDGDAGPLYESHTLQAFCPIYPFSPVCRRCRNIWCWYLN